MKKSHTAEKVIIFNNGHRADGEAVLPDGKKIQWDSAYIISAVKFGDERGRLMKYKVAESSVEEIDKQLADVNFGSLLSLEFAPDGKVCSVNVLCDWYDSVSDSLQIF